MAAFEEHCQDCARLLSDRCEEVNRWLDAGFKRFGPLHRFWRHHSRGIDEAEKLFGTIGRKAAMIHILKDCGHIPSARDWEEQMVDSLGISLKTSKGELLITSSGSFAGFWNVEQFDIAARNLLERDKWETGFARLL
jgi:hypothetical protein